jgi:hypothetical protein
MCSSAPSSREPFLPTFSIGETVRLFSLLGGAATAAILLANCASISNLSSARPTGKDGSRLTVAVSKITTKSDTIPIIEQIPDFVFFELMGTTGITDRLDLSLKYTFPTAGFLEGKYCVVISGPETGFFFSPALRVGYTSFPSDSTSDNNRVETSLPLYLSYYPTKIFGMTIAPVYAARFFLGESRVTQLAGGMASFAIGNRTGLLIEGDYLYNFAWKWHEIQVGAALFVPVKNLFSSLKLF